MKWLLLVIILASFGCLFELGAHSMKQIRHNLRNDEPLGVFATVWLLLFAGWERRKEIFPRHDHPVEEVVIYQDYEADEEADEEESDREEEVGAVAEAEVATKAEATLEAEATNEVEATTEVEAAKVQKGE